MKIVIHTLGCKVNQYESDSLQLALENRGFNVSNKLEAADIFIANTCAVTNEAEKKSRQLISKFQKLKSDAKIFICGCASEKNSCKFTKFKNVHFVSGVANKTKIIDKIEKFCENKNLKTEACVEVDVLPTDYNENYFSKPTKTRAFVKIQDGCNNFCSYCIIPYLRGRSRSRNLIEILNEIDTFGESVKEIVLTGINISDYKIDGELALGDLLKELKSNRLRVRLGSIEQGVIDEKFIKEIDEIKNICPHFHLSLQSGSNSVLKRMNRHYTTQQFFESVKLLRNKFVNPAITTDVIVGFPGETEKEFIETLKFVKKIGFANIHIFPYSKREGTVASKLKDLDGKIKKQRVERLEKLNQRLKNSYIKKSKKHFHIVLIEEKEGDFFIGYTENYIKCYIKEKNLLPNTFINVKLKKKHLDGVIAKVI